MKKAKTLIILLIFCGMAYAAQDSNITIKNTKGLCFYINDVDCQYCDNESFSLEGTDDHIIHLTTQRPYSNCDNWSADSNQTIRTYISSQYTVDYVLVGIFAAVFLGWVFARGGRRR